jgi:tetratricopeptide (TPR) repeat protein
LFHRHIVPKLEESGKIRAMLRLFIFVTIISLAFSTFLYVKIQSRETTSNVQTPNAEPTGLEQASQIQLLPLPQSKTLVNDYHIFQSFNNCGPAALSMTLSYYGINISQAELGQQLRPYQIPGGNNDDKSVTLEELAKKGEAYDLIAYHRPNGNPELIKQFINYDIPVITRTWLHENEDIGHFRVMKGFDERTKEFIQDDSYENKNLRYSYETFNTLWEKYNYEYLVLVPKDKQQIAEEILGENKDEIIAWKNAVQLSQKQILENPDNIYARFNLSVAYFHIGDYKNSVKEFEAVEERLPFRTLWYQIEPIEAYYHLKDYDRVFAITDRILNNHNRAFSELYIIRGNIYKMQGNIDAARNEFEQAVFYNVNLPEAQEALNSL